MDADEVASEGFAFQVCCIPGTAFIGQEVAKSITWQPAHITVGVYIRPNIWGEEEAETHIPVKTDLFRINNTANLSSLNHGASEKLGDIMSAN